jgi:hypothetical protein
VTDNVEDLVRGAYARLAERAVHPERVSSALPALTVRHTRQRRYRALAGVAAAVAVAVVATVPALVLTSTSRRPAADLPTPAGGQFRLRYHPTWLPEGMRETSREANLSGSMSVPDPPKFLTRTWSGAATSPGVRPELRLDVLHLTDAGYPASGYPNPGQGEPVDVNGAAGRYNSGSPPSPHGGSPAAVVWRVDSATVLTLSSLSSDLSKSDLLKTARSVQADPDEAQFPVTFGWLSPGLGAGFAQFNGDSPTVWSASVSAQSEGVSVDIPGGPSAVYTYISATLGPTSDPLVPAGGKLLTVRGHPARLVSKDMSDDYPHIERHLVVELGPGEILTVYASVTQAQSVSEADLVKTAERLHLDPHPDTAWIGAR